MTVERPARGRVVCPDCGRALDVYSPAPVLTWCGMPCPHFVGFVQQGLSPVALFEVDRIDIQPDT